MLETLNRRSNDLQNALWKSLPTVSLLVGELSNFYDNFLDLKVSRFILQFFFYQFWIHLTWYFKYFSQDQCKQNNFIHGYTVSVPVLILPIILVVVVKKWRNFDKIFVLNRAHEQTHRPNSRWQQQSYFTSFLNNFATYFRIGITFHSTVISNKIKYQGIRRNLIEVIFCRRTMAFT